MVQYIQVTHRHKLYLCGANTFQFENFIQKLFVQWMCVQISILYISPFAHAQSYTSIRFCVLHKLYQMGVSVCVCVRSPAQNTHIESHCMSTGIVKDQCTKLGTSNSIIIVNKIPYRYFVITLQFVPTRKTSVDANEIGRARKKKTSHTHTTHIRTHAPIRFYYYLRNRENLQPLEKRISRRMRVKKRWKTRKGIDTVYLM